MFMGLVLALSTSRYVIRRFLDLRSSPSYIVVSLVFWIGRQF
jgi:hypothetical protein